MIKYAILLINFAGLFLFNLFTDAEIMVENNAPTYLIPGQKKEVQVRINKKSIEGFAKMEISVPAGFVVTAGETLGASFTCSQQKARFVWMTLPQSEDFIVTYYLECIEGMAGNHTLTGVFSYIQDNKRLDYMIPVRSVSIVKEEPAAQPVASSTPPFPVAGGNAASSASTAFASEPSPSVSSGTESTKPASTSNNDAPTASASNANVSEPMTSSLNTTTTPSRTNSEATIASGSTSRPDISRNVSQEPALGSFSEDGMFVKPTCTRKVERITDEQYEVTVTISENDIQGFARIFEIVPNGCSTEIVQDGAAMTTREANTVKFVWFEVPSSPIVIVKYRINCTEPQSTTPAVNGKLSFVLDQKPVDLMIVNEGQPQSEVALAQTPTSTNPTVSTSGNGQTKNSDTAQTTAQPKKSESTTTTTPQSESKPTGSTEIADAGSRNKPVTNVPSAETGIKYKVQILAAHRVVDKSYFQKKHGYKEGFNIENHEGWVKYTTGSFGEYRSARDERERLKTDYNSLPGPFVTAYNNGERITVQEALLITKQQWYQ